MKKLITIACPFQNEQKPGAVRGQRGREIERSRLISPTADMRDELTAALEATRDLTNCIEHPYVAVVHHNDSITLPEGFERLGYSKRCRVQVMKSESGCVYTVQFHAEISNPQLIRNFAGMYA